MIGWKELGDDVLGYPAPENLPLTSPDWLDGGGDFDPMLGYGDDVTTPLLGPPIPIIINNKLFNYYLHEN